MSQPTNNAKPIRFTGYLRRDVPAHDAELTSTNPGTPMGEYMRRFWQPVCLSEELTDAPKALDETVRYDEAWLRPDLMFAQTCGYPYVRHLRGKVQLVATPVYDLPGCDGPMKPIAIGAPCSLRATGSPVVVFSTRPEMIPPRTSDSGGSSIFPPAGQSRSGRATATRSFVSARK